MNILQIGLGSMGKRRIRCLQSLGYTNIIGFDLRADRRLECEEKYRITTIAELTKINFSNINCMIISVPPDKHLDYIKIAIDNDKSAFVEASVILEHSIEAKDYLKNKNIFIAPSCTMIFNPIVIKINEIVKSEKFGRMTNFTFHSGQYLPDWHSWENIKDFYVSNRSTGGAREIVPFELTWITWIFGFPIESKGFFNKTIDLDIDIEDTYSFNMKFKNGVGVFTVDVASRFATRSLILNLEKAQLRWNWEEGELKIFDSKNNQWKSYCPPKQKSEAGYNENISEKPYIDEIDAYFNAVNNNKKYPNNLENDIKVLNLLEDIEESDGGFNRKV